MNRYDKHMTTLWQHMKNKNKQWTKILKNTKNKNKLWATYEHIYENNNKKQNNKSRTINKHKDKIRKHQGTSKTIIKKRQIMKTIRTYQETSGT